MSKIEKTMPRCPATTAGIQCELPADHKKMARSAAGQCLPWAKSWHYARVGTGVASWPTSDRKPKK